MVPSNPASSLDKTRSDIARKVQALRKERRWTQAELSRRLGLSQSRLSEIESGAGSFTAEQFLTILKLFNVAASDFARQRQDEGSELQNALARLGALHLQQNEDVLPSERLSGVHDVIREALVSAEYSRLVAALAPVLVRQVDHLQLNKLHLELREAGYERRLGWLVENTLAAIGHELPDVSEKPWARLYRRAQVVLGAFFDFLSPEAKSTRAASDVLDGGIRSKQTLEEVSRRSSDISRRWNIFTSIQPEDFARALRGARVAR